MTSIFKVTEVKKVKFHFHMIHLEKFRSYLLESLEIASYRPVRKPIEFEVVILIFKVSEVTKVKVKIHYNVISQKVSVLSI